MVMAADATVEIDAHGDREGAPVLELADGTRLVAEGGAEPARLEGDRDHVFTLADVQEPGAGPFAGYVRRGLAS
ncbi:MAG: hypothetical protein R2691_07225 [Solirubrobacterales bacterium]